MCQTALARRQNDIVSLLADMFSYGLETWIDA
jgi:hypothetical protein